MIFTANPDSIKSYNDKDSSKIKKSTSAFLNKQHLFMTNDIANRLKNNSEKIMKLWSTRAQKDIQEQVEEVAQVDENISQHGGSTTTLMESKSNQEI